MRNLAADFRHTCEQHEGMAGYGWDEYDVRSGGRQTIHDEGNDIDLTTEFIKVPGGNHGGSWGVRIRGTPRDSAPPDLKTTVIFSAGMEGLGSLEVANSPDPLGMEGTVSLEGQTSELGDFKIDITEGPNTNAHPRRGHQSYDEKPLDRTMVASFQVPEEALWQTKPLMFTHMKKEIDGYIEKYGTEQHPPPWQTFTISNEAGPGNLHLIQKVFEGPFESVGESFLERFSHTLAPNAPFDTSDYERFSQSLFSNLIGGIGYFYGDSLVDRSYASEYEEENEGFWEETAEARGRSSVKIEGPSELYTSIPSRPFFPRGFLWDEGFHLLPVVDWDIDLTLDIVKSWFSLMDEDGWIGREQILGPEARSKVPQEFQVQYPHYANPPTLFLVLESFVDKLNAGNSNGKKSLNEQDLGNDLHTTHLDNDELAIQYLRDLYPLLKRHYFWFRRTQWGDIKSYDREAYSTREAYRWRGRTPQHILTSGLDDYPRAQPPHPGELHVDLISWMGMMTRSIKRIAETLGEAEDTTEFAGYETAIVRNIDDLHWSNKHQTYCDATIDDYEESAHVCHKGYISIFPFMTGLLPSDSPHLKAVLDLISDPTELWSDFGVRSLSQKDEFYGTEENYWRSPIWMNMNYLIVNALLTHAQTPGPHQTQATEIYTSLRQNLVQTVYEAWEKTGFAWEQYNPDTGEGQRTQHFTGWTSLVVKMMTMPDLKEGKRKGGAHDEL
ncbi:MAG: Processing alpha glucosidase I [Pycnora praestabilis]|nr:MAG: Processing alpha glucosidase I [Pycnora praestabilis]